MDDSRSNGGEEEYDRELCPRVRGMSWAYVCGADYGREGEECRQVKIRPRWVQAWVCYRWCTVEEGARGVTGWGDGDALWRVH